MEGRFWGEFRKRYAALLDVGIGVCFGALIEFVIVPLVYWTPWPVGAVIEGTWAVRNRTDSVADALMRLSAAVPASPRRERPYVFVDIDQATWTSWHSPLITPRDRLAAVIDKVSRLDPVVVFVDVDISFPVPKDTDTPLRTLLRDYERGPTERAPLVLVRAIISGRTEPSNLLEERPTDYDSLAVSPNIIWASSIFQEGSDGVVRSWRLVEPVCVRGAPKVLPSAELALAAIATSKTASLAETMRKLTPLNCATREHSERTAPSLSLGHNLVVEFAEGESKRRIPYTLEWRQQADAELSQPRFLGPKIDFNGRLTPLVAVLPIGKVLDVGPDALRDVFVGSIVVIGGSFEQSEDIHLTPLGPMPGAMIVINSVHALLSFGTSHEPNPWQRLTYSFALIVVTALSFHWLRPAVAAIVMAGALFILMIATLSSYRSGVILDLALPATGVLVHRELLALSAFVRALRKEGWRALLARSEEAAP